MDPDGNIHIEGIGVVPDIVVPVTEENLFGKEDAVLETAVNFLVGAEIDGGAISLGNSIDGTILPGERIHYTLALESGDFFSMVLQSNTDGVNLILTVYDDNGNQLAVTDPDDLVGFTEIELDQDVTFVLEISTVDNAETADYTLVIVDESE